MDKNVIDAEFTVVSEPTPPLKWWQGWRISYDPAFIVPGAVAAALAVLARLA